MSSSRAPGEPLRVTETLPLGPEACIATCAPGSSAAAVFSPAPITLHPPFVEAPESPTAGPDDLPPPGEDGRGQRRPLPTRLVRGRPDDPPWVRPALLTLLAATGLLYLWDLGASGWANSFYSAAVQASTKSWKAFFFGSFDASNLITVDKPAISLWPMDISARLFGVNAWSILVPQALMGVATVGLVYATVRRWFTPAAGLLAGAVTALTPVAVLMFRYNNPDAFLVLLLTAATYAVTRALERASTRWLAFAGALVGFAFLTKYLQALLVVPAFAVVYLVAAPASFWRRVRQLCMAAASVVVAGGWWVATVELWPAASRPYIGGSQNNNVLSLIFGYNGFGRITGNETGSVTGGLAARAGRAGGPGGASVWGHIGWSRLFNVQFGGQDAWLLPAALACTVAIVAMTRRAPRTDRTRAAGLLWGGSLLVSGAVISFSQGIIHPYYTVALAPAIGALVGVGGTALWAKRDRLSSRLTIAAVALGSGMWAAVLLDRTPSWHPWIRTTVVAVAVVAAIAVVVGPRLKRLGMVFAGVGCVAAALLGPTTYSVATAAQPHAGAIPSAGPSGASLGGGPGPNGRIPGPLAGRFGSRGQGIPGGFPGPPGGVAGPPGAFGGAPNGAPPANVPNGFPGAVFGRGVGSRPGGGGGLLGSPNPSPTLVRLLETNASRYTWVAAAVGSNNAAGYQLATGDPVMSLGGFNGSDPAPTLAQFQGDVAARKVHYFIGGGGLGVANGGSSAARQITTWVETHFTSTTVGGVTVYDLTS